MSKAKGRTASGRIKKGYRLTKGGAVVKARSKAPSRRRGGAVRRRRRRAV